jgi:hypothetical protein
MSRRAWIVFVVWQVTGEVVTLLSRLDDDFSPLGPIGFAVALIVMLPGRFAALMVTEKILPPSIGRLAVVFVAVEVATNLATWLAIASVFRRIAALRRRQVVNSK